MARAPRTKIAWRITLEQGQRGLHTSHHVGVFATKEYGVSKAENSFGYKSGAFNTILADRVRLPRFRWEELKSQEEVNQ